MTENSVNFRDKDGICGAEDETECKDYAPCGCDDACLTCAYIKVFTDKCIFVPREVHQ